MEISPLKALLGFSTVLDLAHPQLAYHHKTVAYISFNLATEMGIQQPLKNELLLSALVHDLGILSWKESLDVHRIEAIDPHRHAYLAYLLIKDVSFFKKVAPSMANIILYHHAPWKEMKNPHLRPVLLDSIARVTEVEISLPSYILSLADKVSFLLQPGKFILHQAGEIKERIKALAESELPLDVVEAFLELSGKESFWLEMIPPHIEFFLHDLPDIPIASPNLSDCLSFARFICDVVDLHSPFTAVHSQGVAAVGEKLAELAGFPQPQWEKMRIAGYLHDLGKLAIPTRILEKNDKLTEEESAVVRAHPFYTYSALSFLGDSEIRRWASFHHENLDGTGYPFHLGEEELDLGARIMRVADVFSALREYRPYRNVMMKQDVLGILRKLAEDKALDGGIVSLVERNYDEVDTSFLQAQFSAQDRYQKVWRKLAHVSPP